MTVAETARALNVASEDFVYRLLRTGDLRGEKIDGRWRIDAASVEARKRRVSLKRSSKSNAAAERDRKRAEIAGAFE